MITPRTTRLVRTAGTGAFREALVSLVSPHAAPQVAADADPLAARDRLVIIPTRAAAAHLVRAIETRRVRDGLPVVLPEFATAAELPARLAERLPELAAPVDAARREVLLGVACRAIVASGLAPPFQLRPGLIAEILQFYDALRRQRRDVDTFERLALGILEPGADHDRGAERLVRQTRFLVAAFRRFEQLSAERGWVDEHAMRRAVLEQAASHPWRYLVVAVGERARDPYGLIAADWDLLSRVPGLERLDVVVTDGELAGAFHQRVHELLPGIEEVRFECEPAPAPRLRVPGDGLTTWVARDREEEVASFARWVRQAVRDGEVAAVDGMALAVRQPLPYVYLAREVLRSAGIACQTFDALPLAGEPYAAAVDLVFSAVEANFARTPLVALVRSPHFRFERQGEALWGGTIASLDRALSDRGYLGGVEALAAIDNVAGIETLVGIAAELQPLTTAAPAGEHLSRLISFLRSHENLPGPDDPLRLRQLRARGAILGLLGALRDAYGELDDEPVGFDRIAALVRRWIEGHTFAPRSGDQGVHVVDVASARFGDFSHVQLAGLVDGEWPERPRRNVFYSPSILRELGWPPEIERLDGARAAFVDLLTLATEETTISAFALENDAVVAVSTLADEAEQLALERRVTGDISRRVFDYEAMAMEPTRIDALAGERRTAAERRLAAADADPDRYRGTTSGHAAPAFSLSALERYQDCPFKFFAADVLRLEEAPEDEASLSPRARGRFIHEVFQRFFEAWGRDTVTPERFDEARAMFAAVAERLLPTLPPADAAIERTRLFGSAISTGIVDVVLGLEAARPVDVTERWLEYRLEGEFTLGSGDDRRVMLKGVADRIDLLEGNRLRVVDYKSGYAPEPKRALQVPIYALCAQERLTARDDAPWRVEEAAYIAFTGKRSLVSIVRADAGEREAPLAAARERLHAVLDGISRGEFPPQPHDPRICTWCAYAPVCRKDYVGDE